MRRASTVKDAALWVALDGEDLPPDPDAGFDIHAAVQWSLRALRQRWAEEARVYRAWPDGPGGRELLAIVRL